MRDLDSFSFPSSNKRNNRFTFRESSKSTHLANKRDLFIILSIGLVISIWRVQGNRFNLHNKILYKDLKKYTFSCARSSTAKASCIASNCSRASRNSPL